MGNHFPAVTVGLLRRSISGGSSNRRSQARALGTRVSGPTLCPLGQSNKAIGQESPIGPCVATHRVDNCQACWVSEKRWAPSQQRNGTTGKSYTRRQNRALSLSKTTHEARVHVQTVGLNAETKKDRHRAEGEIFLDIPFNRTSAVSALIWHCDRFLSYP
jgi:hypothetical protein